MFLEYEVPCGPVVSTTVLLEGRSDYPTEEARSFEGGNEPIDGMRDFCANRFISSQDGEIRSRVRVDHGLRCPEAGLVWKECQLGGGHGPGWELHESVHPT